MFKKMVFFSITFILLGCTIIILWLYHHEIINGRYEKLTISNMENTKTTVITDKIEIGQIVNHINNSPRMLRINCGFRYDYLPHGLLTFENNKEKVEIGYVITTGNVCSKYSEINTDLKFQ